MLGSKFCANIKIIIFKGIRFFSEVKSDGSKAVSVMVNF